MVVLVGAGEALERLNEPARAADRYLAAGRKAEEQGQLATALDLYLRIRRSLPVHVGARERLFALRKAAGAHKKESRYDAEREGWELAQILCYLDRKDDLATVFQGLLELTAGDPAKSEKLADLAIGMGNVGFAIDALLAGADELNKHREFHAAMRLVKRAQGLDPSRASLSARISAIGSSMQRLKARRRSLVRVAAMIAGSVLFSFGYARYSSAAMDEFGRFSVEDFLASGDFDGGREHFRAICRRYPLTVPFLLSMEKLRALDIAQRNATEVERYRAQVEEEQRESAIRQAESLKKAAVAARTGGDWSRAAELLRKARALCGEEDLLGLDESLKELDEYLADVRRLKSEAAFFRRAGRFDKAHARLKELVERFPSVRTSERIELPVLIESEPSRARITVNGKPVTGGDNGFTVHAETPFVVDLIYGEPAQVELSREGYATARVDVDPVARADVKVTLPLPVVAHVELPYPAFAGSVSDGSRVVVPMERGRIGLFDASTLAERWTRELPDLADVTGAPVLRGDEVVVPISTGQVLRLNAVSGITNGALNLSGVPRTDLVTSAGRMAVGVDRDAVCVIDAGATTSELVRLEHDRTAGPVGLDDGRFVVGCADGSVWIVGSDGATDLGVQATAGRAVTSLGASRGFVLVGDDGGRLHACSLSGQTTSTVDALVGGEVTSINADGRVAIVEGPGGIAAFQIDPLLAAATYVEGALKLASGGGSMIAATRSTGEIVVFERATLRRVSNYMAEGNIRLRGMVSGSRGYFALADGGLSLIFCQRR